MGDNADTNVPMDEIYVTRAIRESAQRHGDAEIRRGVEILEELIRAMMHDLESDDEALTGQLILHGLAPGNQLVQDVLTAAVASMAYAESNLKSVFGSQVSGEDLERIAHEAASAIAKEMGSGGTE
ncbi:hypothetical protein SEA_BLACKBEETLE_25 [Mycobacterium phage Blackbeetle]|uniref:Uncharacterized protein n=5 Tax=Marvinvirus mosmoris TaxID=1982093 RepID=A0A3S9U998_9CAUD|nr:hypothetical protein FH33_gp023 [Mycobacterium phage MosMoris]ANM46247.1 hypothetical protein SEA_GATTACA_24 [Mycobacterium phage Gattaca]AZS06789.1 hypothetical protein SEA_RAELA_25 [Mycobacterium phage Raela]QBQ71315.1 hypothetical protein SEA_BLACKBEETLE_25 [Mycobacterium phage Blackbeetle]QFP94351.1 hypothetical protein SEA_POISE_25 [Mycobacterium phage Poise]AHY84097.1 hypothetical protein PBI_MOSMORIS_23 [Mycobacterium phage MosMoris]